MEFPKRKPTRYPKIDYNTPGAYFVTLCTVDREKILSNISEREPHSFQKSAIKEEILTLTDIGKNVETAIMWINGLPYAYVDRYVIMPNHLHMIIVVKRGAACSFEEQMRANEKLPQIISTFKRLCSNKIGVNIFQRSYHDRLIRNQKEYEKIVDYIEKNPLIWQYDCFYG